MQYFVVHVIIQKTTGTLNFMDVRELTVQIFIKTI